MENQNAEDAATAAAEAEAQAKAEAEAPSHEKPERTERKKAEFSLKKNAERLRELGGNPTDVLGVKPQIQIDETLSDDTPLTVGAFRQIQKQDAKQTAIQLAEEIEDEDERAEVKGILETRLVPSGDPHADLALVRAAVNAKRTGQIAEEVNRKTKPTRTAAGGSASARTEEIFEPTEQEAIFMRPPYNVSKEKIIAARKKAQE